ncbi:MAG TPA: hypothetical protein VGR37_24475 [Longimicrobiaceae bacterium]|nr:hypothetical protein [Longimicrobiaceae bacterium]
MDTPEQAEIRAAAQKAAEQIGVRKLGRAVGMSTGGIQKALYGEQLRQTTWTKLRAWYAREWAPKQDPASGGVVLEALLQQIAPAFREEARRAITDHLSQLYGRAQLPAPGWLLEQPGTVVAYDRAKQEYRAPFAVLELSRGSSLVIPEQPFPGDPRDVVEQIASGRGVWHDTTYYPAHRIHRVRYRGEEEAEEPT